MSFWDSLDPQYRLILCDIWGVVHDGVNLYPGAANRLQQWRSEGRCVVLITNAPRTAEAVEAQLARIGLSRDEYDAVATSGEAGIEALNALGKPVGFVGTAGDREILEGRGVRIAATDDFTDLACTGLQEVRPKVEDYRVDLERWAERDVHMHCLNPDRLVLLERWSSQAALDAHARLQRTRPPLPPGLRQGDGEREDYEYNRTR